MGCILWSDNLIELKIAKEKLNKTHEASSQYFLRHGIQKSNGDMVNSKPSDISA